MNCIMAIWKKYEFVINTEQSEDKTKEEVVEQKALCEQSREPIHGYISLE